MWRSEKEIYCHVPNAERCVNVQDTKKQKEYGDMAIAYFTHAMYTAAARGYAAESIKQRWLKRRGQGKTADLP